MTIKQGAGANPALRPSFKRQKNRGPPINNHDEKQVEVNPGYAVDQFNKALARLEESVPTDETEQANVRVRKWTNVLKGMASGFLQIGSRQPVEGTPPWVTLEVAHGGFATGQFLAAGPLDEFELVRLRSLGREDSINPRLHLNLSFLSDSGPRELASMLESGCFRISVPEHSALLIVAGLGMLGQVTTAHPLLTIIEPWMDRLRFYPEPSTTPIDTSGTVHLESVGQVVDRLQRTVEHERIATQNETLNVWLPLHDQFVQLFVDSSERPSADAVADIGDALVNCNDAWCLRASKLLLRYEELRGVHTRSSKPDRRGQTFCDLRSIARRVVEDPAGATSSTPLKKRAKELLRRDFAKRGSLQSHQRQSLRSAQARDGRIPTHASAAEVVSARLSHHDPDAGLPNPEATLRPEIDEVERTRLFGETINPDATAFHFPDSVRRKVLRCLEASVEELVSKGLVSSGDVLATLIPQIAGLEMAKQFTDARLQNVFSQTYRAFRSRRSLLLLNLQSQVRFEELPWVAALMQMANCQEDAKASARRTFVQAAVLNLQSFPYAIVPNKLLQELRALAKAADLRIDLLDEVAADIFMGEFSQKFGRAAKLAAEQLDGSLYARYYEIDTQALLQMNFGSGHVAAGLGELCFRRAGVRRGGWSSAVNGQAIEQQQILTTQNLAALYAVDEVREAITPRLMGMALVTFKWLTSELSIDRPDHHSRLITVKNVAYAWRQLLFFLSKMDEEDLHEFMDQSETLLDDYAEQLADRFRPAMEGLRNVVAGKSAESGHGMRLLGWTTSGHWLLEA